MEQELDLVLGLELQPPSYLIMVVIIIRAAKSTKNSTGFSCLLSVMFFIKTQHRDHGRSGSFPSHLQLSNRGDCCILVGAEAPSKDGEGG